MDYEPQSRLIAPIISPTVCVEIGFGARSMCHHPTDTSCGSDYHRMCRADAWPACYTQFTRVSTFFKKSTRAMLLVYSPLSSVCMASGRLRDVILRQAGCIETVGSMQAGALIGSGSTESATLHAERRPAKELHDELVPQRTTPLHDAANVYESQDEPSDNVPMSGVFACLHCPTRRGSLAIFFGSCC